jgi:hypothetical protein
MSTRRASSAAALLAAAALAGCGPEDPYTTNDPSPSRTGQSVDAETSPRAAGQPSVAPEAGELPGRAPPALLDEPTEFPEAGETPRATLALAARLYGNWTSTSAARRLRRIAALSVGQAHAELRQAAAQSRVDRQQRGARSRATVEAISVRGHGPRRGALVVTRERIIAPDLPSESWRYRVTAAELERRPDGWVISRWAPQP